MYLLITLALMLWIPTAWVQDKPEDSSTVADTIQENTAKKPQRPPSAVARPKVPVNESQSMALLAKDFPSGALVWLNAGQERFLSIWQKDRSGFPKGALFIIHAEGEHPAWPKTIKPLHDTLPDYGWATLAISLPNPDRPSIPERTLAVKVKSATMSDVEKPENKEGEQQESTTEDETEQRATTSVLPKVAPTGQKIEFKTEQIAEQRLESALKFLHDQGQFNIIMLGNSRGAIRAQDFINKITPQVNNPELKENLEKPIRALVIVNGKNSLPAINDNYEDWFTDPEIPVLDIFLPSNRRNHQESKHRKILARQKKVLSYKQVRLSRLNNEKTWGENQLSRRIRSFLDSNAAGVEINNATLRK